MLGGAPETVSTLNERQADLRIRPRIATIDGQGISGFTENTATTLRQAKNRTETRLYSGITRALKTVTIEETLARGIAGNDAYRDNEGGLAYVQLPSLEDTTEVTVSGITGKVLKEVQTIRKPYCLFDWSAGSRPANYDVARFTLKTCYKRTTEWKQVDTTFGKSQNETWNIYQVVERPQGVLYSDYEGNLPEVLVPDPSESFDRTNSDGSTEPPAVEYQEDIAKPGDTQYSGSVALEPIAGNAHKLRESTISVSAPAIVSDAQCGFLAKLFGRLQHGLSLGYQFIGAIPDEILSSFSPGMRLDVTHKGVVTAYLLTSWSIVSDVTETLWSASLAEIGIVGAAAEDVVSRFTVIITPSGITATPTVGIPEASVIGDIPTGLTVTPSVGSPFAGIAGQLDGVTVTPTIGTAEGIVSSQPDGLDMTPAIGEPFAIVIGAPDGVNVTPTIGTPFVNEPSDPDGLTVTPRVGVAREDGGSFAGLTNAQFTELTNAEFTQLEN